MRNTKGKYVYVVLVRYEGAGLDDTDLAVFSGKSLAEKFLENLADTAGEEYIGGAEFYGNNRPEITKDNTHVIISYGQDGNLTAELSAYDISCPVHGKIPSVGAY